MEKIILSAFADEYSSRFSEQLEALNRFGIEYLELRGVDGKNVSELDKQTVKEMKVKADRHGIKFSAIGSPLGKIKLDGDLSSHLETAKRIFEASNILECKNVRVFSYYAPEGKDIHKYKNEVTEDLKKMLDAAESFGITLCHENESGIYGEAPEHCLELLEHFDGRLKCVFDMGNFALEGYDPLHAYGLLKEHIEYFHIKDALAAGAIVPPGKGEAKIKEILDAYSREYDRKVFITLEPHLQTFSGLNALTDRHFDNPYKYEDPQTAFTDAVSKIKEIISQ